MTPERKEFLTNVLIGAIENGGHGWFEVREYEHEAEMPYAEIAEDDDSVIIGHIVTLKTIQTGIGVIRNAILKDIESDYEWDKGVKVLHNAKTNQRLYLHPNSRKAILEASSENDAGELDVVDYLAILECGLFGYVAYC